jgi:hypothetical protein
MSVLLPDTGSRICGSRDIMTPRHLTLALHGLRQSGDNEDEEEEDNEGSNNENK